MAGSGVFCGSCGHELAENERTLFEMWGYKASPSCYVNDARQF
jgi:hypothetical protein